MKNVKIIGLLFFILLFVFIFWNISDGNIKPGKIKQEDLCNKSFLSTSYVKSIGMKVETKTTFNCDGTFESGEYWSAQDHAKQAYQNSGYSTSGEFGNFYGTYEIIEQRPFPSDVDSYFMWFYGHEYDDNKDKITLIKYQSSNGISGYAFIRSGYENNIYLSIMFMKQISKDSYKNSGSLGMWEGLLE